MAELVNYEPADIEIHIKDKGMVLKEKSLVAVQKSDGKILAIGKEAEETAAKNPEHVQLVSPLRRGMIADYTIASGMFKYMVEKTWGKRLFYKPHIVVCVPEGRTEVENKALEEVIYFASAGAKEIVVYEGALGQFIEGMQAHHAKRYAAHDVLIAIAKNEPEKYISEELCSMLNYAARHGISSAEIEKLLRIEQERRLGENNEYKICGGKRLSADCRDEVAAL